jgi:hypothetical protein
VLRKDIEALRPAVDGKDKSKPLDELSKIERIEYVMQEVFSETNGKAPDGMPYKNLHAKIDPVFEKYKWELPDDRTIRRAKALHR